MPDRSISWGEPTTPPLRITSFLYMLKGLCQENKGYMVPGSQAGQEQQLGGAYYSGAQDHLLPVHVKGTVSKE
jgi:hypothetical protein